MDFNFINICYLLYLIHDLFKTFLYPIHAYPEKQQQNVRDNPKMTNGRFEFVLTKEKKLFSFPQIP